MPIVLLVVALLVVVRTSLFMEEGSLSLAIEILFSKRDESKPQIALVLEMSSTIEKAAELDLSNELIVLTILGVGTRDTIIVLL